MPNRMLIQIPLVILMVSFCRSSTADAQVRTWTDVRGGQLFGRFRELKKHNLVVISSKERTVKIPFWNLMPDDQKQVVYRLRTLRRTENIPPVSDAPREWTRTDGSTFRGQLLWAGKTGGAVVVNGSQRTLKYEELSQPDSAYAMEWPGPVLQQTGTTNQDAHVPPSAPDNEFDEFGRPRIAADGARGIARLGFFASKSSAKLFKAMIVGVFALFGVVIKLLLGRGRRQATT